MHYLLWIFYAREAYVTLAGGFIVAMNLKRLRDEESPYFRFWAASCVELIALAWVMDVAWNATAGRVLYGEWRKLKFSEHTQFVLDHQPRYLSREVDAAFRWGRRLDAIAVSHIVLPARVMQITAGKAP